MSEERAGPRQVTISDPQVMRALAHPARLAIMEYLGASGASASATECAEVVGLSPSATSYHLRALAKFGLVEEAPSRGDARERLWRSMSQTWYVDAGRAADPEVRAAEGALLEAHAVRDAQRVRDWLRRAGDEPFEWYNAAMFANTQLLLTAEELTTLNAEFDRLVEPYRRRHRTGSAPDGARVVAVQYRTVPLE